MFNIMGKFLIDLHFPCILRAYNKKWDYIVEGQTKSEIFYLWLNVNNIGSEFTLI